MVTGGIRGSEGAELVSGGEACEALLGLEAKFGDSVFEWGNGDHVVKGVDWGGAEGAADATHCLILSNLKNLKERFGGSLQPEHKTIGEDREDDSRRLCTNWQSQGCG